MGKITKNHSYVWKSLWAILGYAAASFPSIAQTSTLIVPSTGSEGSSPTLVTTIDGRHSIDGGEVAGKNLFHTFDAFDLASGETAVWLRSAGDASGFDFLINRVVGGRASRIDGHLDTTAFVGADVYFLNDAGVIFGDNASVSIPRGFHVSTANRIGFADGSVLSADQVSGSSLTAASPKSFGFDDSAPIVIDGAKLTGFDAGQSVSFSGGDIHVRNGALIDVPSGELVLAAIGSANEVDVFNTPTDLSQTALGDVHISGGAEVFADAYQNAPEAAKLSIIAENVLLTEDIQVTSDNLSTLEGGRVELRATGNLVIESGSVLRASALSSGSSKGVLVDVDGTVTIDGRNAPDVTAIASSSQPRNNVAQGGDAGPITIDASAIRLVGGAQIQSISNLRGGNSGALTLRADLISLDGNGDISPATTISNSLEAGAFGQSSLIFIEASTLEIKNGSSIQSSTAASGDGGMIVLEVADAVLLDGGNAARGGIFSQSRSGASGDGGNIEIGASHLSINNGAEITASSNSFGASGTITIIVPGDLAITGATEASTGVFAESGRLSAGKLGDIFIEANGVDMRDGGAISAVIESENPLAEDLFLPSRIEIRSRDTLRLSDGAFISAESLGRLRAGDISLQATSVELTGADTQVSSRNSSGDRGAGGTIDIAGSSIIVSDSAAVTTSAETGTAGRVSLTSDGAITLRENAAIRSASRRASAGEVVLSALEGITIDAGSSVSTNSEEATAGDVRFQIGPDTFLVLRSSEVTTSGVRGAGGEDSGGRIFVERVAPDEAIGGVVLIESLLEALGDGSGALLQIDPESALVLDNLSTIAVDGTLIIPETDTSDATTEGDAEFLNAGDVLDSQCQHVSFSQSSVLQFDDQLRPGVWQLAPTLPNSVALPARDRGKGRTTNLGTPAMLEEVCGRG